MELKKINIIPNFIAMFVGVYVYREHIKPLMRLSYPSDTKETEQKDSTTTDIRTDWQKEIGAMLNKELTEKIKERLCKFKLGKINYTTKQLEIYTEAPDKEPVILSFDRQEKFHPSDIAAFILTTEKDDEKGELVKIVGYDRYTDGSPFVEFKIYTDLQKAETNDLYGFCTNENNNNTNNKN